MSYQSRADTFRMPDGKIGYLEPVSPDAQASQLVDFTIEHDSVVVTVILTPKTEHRAVQVNWGDDSIDYIDFRLPQFQPPAPGSFKIQHEYKKNPNTGFYPNFVLVVLAVYDNQGNKSFEAQGIRLKPRFNCVIYPVLVKASHHDSSFEERSEFDIYLRYQQGERELLSRKWRWDAKTLDIDWFSTTVIVAERYLEGSQFSSEITLQDDPICVKPSYVDDDGGWGKSLLKILEANTPKIPVEVLGDLLEDWKVIDFDGSQVLPIHPRFTDGPFEFDYHLGSGSQYMDFHISGSMDVIVPLDRGPIAALGNET